jgi:hypothetical protein
VPHAHLESPSPRVGNAPAPIQRALLALLILTASLPGAVALADTAAQCDVHLIVHLTPDVPDAAASGFLSSLLTNPNFRLAVLGKVGDRAVAMDLSGPGSADNCAQVIDGMRRDARIVSIEVQSGPS